MIVKRLEGETKFAGGIVILDITTEKPIRGEVIAVGNGNIFDDDKVYPVTVILADFAQHDALESARYRPAARTAGCRVTPCRPTGQWPGSVNITICPCTRRAAFGRR